MTPRTLRVLEPADVIVAEDIRNTLKLLTHFGVHTRLASHYQHSEAQNANGFLELLRRGQDIVLASDTGYPLINDPGCTVTQKVIEEGFNIVPTPGNNAMLNTLVSNGMDTRHFLSYGLLKSGEKERIRELYELEYYPFITVSYEVLHCIKKMLVSCLEVLGNHNICPTRELAKKHKEFLRGTIEEILEVAEELEGEMVIVMEGSRGTKDSGEDSVIPLVHEQINTYTKEGLAANEAIKRVARRYGPNKNEVYKQYHGLR